MAPLRILFLASEAEPFVKVGGLGDVAGSLPPAIRASKAGREPVDIRVAIPMHGQVRQQATGASLLARYAVPHRDGPIPVEVYETDLQGVKYYLVSGEPFPPEAPVYSCDNLLDGHKFTFFSLAALDLPKQIGWQPDLIHANDWHTAPAVYALSLRRPSDPFYRQVTSLQAIHNLPYLGVGAGPALTAFGLPPAIQSTLPWWAQDMPLPLGMLAADHIVAVSPSYAAEILTPQFSSGLHDFLVTRQADISGILNGLDTAAWSPLTDQQLAAGYSADDLSGKQACREELKKEIGLAPAPRVPLLGFVGRMEHQKGVDIAIAALRQLTSEAWQAVILGNGLTAIEDTARALALEFPERVCTLIKYDNRLSRKIFAGADILLIPSRYEPCGLTQMIAMRYGSVPVARATGGLKDTIHDYDEPGARTGFLFQDESPEALAATIRRAFAVYQDQDCWHALQIRAMAQDFSWARSAEEYIKLYHHVVRRFRPEDPDH